MIGRWIVHQDKRTRCALCYSQTNTGCKKCQKGVHAKCFREYHMRPESCFFQLGRHWDHLQVLFVALLTPITDDLIL